MQTSKNSNSKHLLFINQKNSPFTKQPQVKSSKNLNISLGANQSIHTFNPHLHQHKSVLELKAEYQRGAKQKSKDDEGYVGTELSKKLNTIGIENQKLREQNEYLRKELQRIRGQKKQSMSYNSKQKYRVLSREQSIQRQSGDLRGTIKKQVQQMGQLKQIRIKLQIVSKQCKMYEQIMDKMQNTICRLTDENKLLHQRIKPQQRHSQKDIRRQQFEMLKQRVGMIMKEYSDLQSKMHSNELEWVIWKEQWITEKNIYLNRIKQLEGRLKERKNEG